MTMTPRLRKLALTAHVTSSVGWIGSVVCFLVLAITGLISDAPEMVHAVYLSMELIARFVIVPLCFASLVTGIVQSLGTKWGLFRHYWILIKFIITILSTIALLVHRQPISYMAEVATDNAISNADLHLQIQLIVAPSLALLALLITTALAVYKPRGLTPYGWRKQYQHRVDGQ